MFNTHFDYGLVRVRSNEVDQSIYLGGQKKKRTKFFSMLIFHLWNSNWKNWQQEKCETYFLFLFN